MIDFPYKEQAITPDNKDRTNDSAPKSMWEARFFSFPCLEAYLAHSLKQLDAVDASLLLNHPKEDEPKLHETFFKDISPMTLQRSLRRS